MVELSDELFYDFVNEAVRDIPDRFARYLYNVAFLTAYKPSLRQRRAGGILHGRSVLLGLYEGIPLPERSAGYSGVTPDVITIFQVPHQLVASNLIELRTLVRQTVWHEVAHYFGLDHGQINALESR